jgi:hypothetical protein
MKTKKIKLLIIFLLLLLLIVAGIGCGQDDEIWEISPDSKTVVIQKEVNGIEFKLCLLNEEGEPSTIFNEGENFTFSFTIINNIEDTLVISTEFIGSEFFRVYQTPDNIDMGKPWTGLWCEYSLAPQKIILLPLQNIQLNCPWILTENNHPVYPLCMSESKYPLAKDQYYTKLNLDFHYSKKREKEQINNLIFKINFKIQ